MCGGRQGPGRPSLPRSLSNVAGTRESEVPFVLSCCGSLQGTSSVTTRGAAGPFGLRLRPARPAQHSVGFCTDRTCAAHLLDSPLDQGEGPKCPTTGGSHGAASGPGRGWEGARCGEGSATLHCELHKHLVPALRLPWPSSGHTWPCLSPVPRPTDHGLDFSSPYCSFSVTLSSGLGQVRIRFSLGVLRVTSRATRPGGGHSLQSRSTSGLASFRAQGLCAHPVI